MSDSRDERRRAIELVIAVAVVVISLASAFTAVYQAVVTRQTLEATVWPRVEWENSNYDEERRTSAITIAIANRGVGPARIADGAALTPGQQRLLVMFERPSDQSPALPRSPKPRSRSRAVRRKTHRASRGE